MANAKRSTKQQAVQSIALHMVKAGLAAQSNVASISESLIKAKASVIATMRDAMPKDCKPLDYEAVRKEIEPAFPAKEGSKVHMVQSAKYAKAIVALSHGFSAGEDDGNFTTFVNKAQAHGVKAGWWQAGKGGASSHKSPKAKAGKAVVVAADAAIGIVTAGCDKELAAAITAACEPGDRTWLIQAWKAEEARRASAAQSDAAKMVQAMTPDQLAQLKKLLAA